MGATLDPHSVSRCCKFTAQHLALCHWAVRIGMLHQCKLSMGSCRTCSQRHGASILNIGASVPVLMRLLQLWKVAGFA